MKIGSTIIEDTFAEAFDMRYARLVITADDEHWLDAAVRSFCGYASSVIACDAEIGVEKTLRPDETLDGRPGVAVLVFGFSADGLAKSLPNRVGQCLMTCPTTAVYNGMPEAERQVPLGKHVRFFGDGYQKSKVVDGRRFWRIPVMDGEFLIEEQAGIGKGVGGGNIIIQTERREQGLAAVRRTIGALRDFPEIICPFPGGVARSGSKVGSRYKGIPASTADAYCPSLRGRVESKVPEGANCCYEIVIDGTSPEAIARAMKLAMEMAAGEGVVQISAGNYGGKLGKHHFHLRKIS